MKILSAVIITIILTVAVIIIFQNIPKRYTTDEMYSIRDMKFQKFNREVAIDSKVNTGKVLVFNSFSYKNDIPEYAKYTTQITKKYADKFGYDFIQFNHKDNELPPYWLRVKDLYDLLNQRKYDVIMYLDLDATFYDFDVHIEEVIASNYDFYIGKDPMAFKMGIPGFSTIINTGCFIVKNTEWSRNFVKTWLFNCLDDNLNLSAACKRNWKLEKNKWKCESCEWAGLNYEQGFLGLLYAGNIHDAQEHVCVFEEDVLSNMYPQVKSYVLHMMGGKDDERTRVFGKLLNSIS